MLFTAVFLWMAGAHATTFISEVKVSTNDNQATAKSQLTNSGYTVIDQDMNQGGSGQYVYIGYKTSTNLADAITGLIIVGGSSYAGTENVTVTQEGVTFQAAAYTSDSKGGNLNRGRGASAADLYLYYTKYGNTTHTSASPWKPITGLAGVASTTERLKSSYPTYVRRYNAGNGYSYLENANLNAGGSASYYTYLNVTSTHTCTCSYSLVVTGTHKYACTVCGYSRSQTACTYGNFISANGDQHYKQCSVCSDKVYMNHSYTGQYTYSDSMQCFTSCQYCNYKLYSNHSFSYYTARDNYSHQRSCSRCNWVEITNHDFPASAYTNNGATGHTKTCTLCPRSVTENHIHVTDTEAIPATCETAGKSEAWHCDKCTYRVYASTSSALGHSYDEYGVCTRTPGQKHYSHAKGDVTCDGNISLADITKLVHVVKNNLWANADYNNDGVLDLTDIEALVNWILGKRN